MENRHSTGRPVLVLAAIALSLFACGGTDSESSPPPYAESTGLPDPGFGTDGLAKVSPAQNLSSVREIAELDDGSLLVGGSNPFIAKLTAQGQLDTTFAVNGIDATRRGTKFFQTVRNITPLTPARIAVVEEHKAPCIGAPFFCAYQSFGDVFARRIDASGNVDTAYGEGGMGQLPFSEGDIVVSPSGRVVSFTIRHYPTVIEFGVASLDPSGQRDLGFEARAQAALQCGARFDLPLAQVRSVAAARSGDKFIVATAWQSLSAPEKGFCVSRLNVDGTIDPDFAEQGHRTLVVDGTSDLNVFRLLLRSSGDIVVVLSPDPGAHNLKPPVLLFVTASGAASGIQATPIFLAASIFDVTLQPDGKIVYVGERALSPGIPTLPLDDENPLAGRSSANAGIYDGGFGPVRGGYVTLRTADGPLRPNRVVIDRRGGILVGGDLVSANQPAVLRLK